MFSVSVAVACGVWGDIKSRPITPTNAKPLTASRQSKPHGTNTTQTVSVLVSVAIFFTCFNNCPCSVIFYRLKANKESMAEHTFAFVSVGGSTQAVKGKKLFFQAYYNYYIYYI